MCRAWVGVGCELCPLRSPGATPLPSHPAACWILLSVERKVGSRWSAGQAPAGASTATAVRGELGWPLHGSGDPGAWQALAPAATGLTDGLGFWPVGLGSAGDPGIGSFVPSLSLYLLPEGLCIVEEDRVEASEREGGSVCEAGALGQASSGWALPVLLQWCLLGSAPVGCDGIAPGCSVPRLWSARWPAAPGRCSGAGSPLL